MTEKTWNPQYTINSSIAKALMAIERARAIVENTPLTPASEAELRRQARIKSTHYSTYIEGNRLTLKETKKVIENRKVTFHGRERDVKEVQHYWEALLRVEEMASRKAEFSEQLIKKIHALVEKGKRAKPTEYRPGQNVIREAGSGKIVYLPPQAKDVPSLMKKMVQWATRAEKEKVPPPIIAALVHYQFVTIHPYYDGNGRTARLLATFVLQRDGYGLNGFFSLEEYHARRLEEYYGALATHQHHNYYEGRADVELTAWVEYFIRLMADVFDRAMQEAVAYADRPIKLQAAELAKLDRRAKEVLALFAEAKHITAAEVAAALRITQRMARYLIKGWLKDGWLLVADKANKTRKYKLSATYRKLIGS